MNGLVRLGALSAAVVLTSIACGGSPTSPPPPPPAAPTITTSNTMIYVGQTIQFSATGSGTIRWGGDAPGVATVDTTTGRVTGTGNGRVTIWAENEGGRTTRLLRGLPSYAGSWSGTYAITGCQSTGDMAAIRFCGNFYQGQVLNIQFEHTQTDDRVSGAFALGSMSGTVNSTSVDESGNLPLTGTINDSKVTIHLQNGRFSSPSAGTISGTFDQSWSVDGASGFGILSCQVRNVTRTSGGPTLRLRMPSEPENLTLEEMIRRVLRK